MTGGFCTDSSQSNLRACWVFLSHAPQGPPTPACRRFGFPGGYREELSRCKLNGDDTRTKRELLISESARRTNLGAVRENLRIVKERFRDRKTAPSSARAWRTLSNSVLERLSKKRRRYEHGMRRTYNAIAILFIARSKITRERYAAIRERCSSIRERW